jgi:hypothetical protein
MAYMAIMGQISYQPPAIGNPATFVHFPNKDHPVRFVRISGYFLGWAGEAR